MYRRANLSRTFLLVVALLLAAISTGAFACQLHGADPQGGSDPIPPAPRSHDPGVLFQSRAEQEQTGTGATTLDRTNVALIGIMTPLLVGRPRRTARM